MSNSRALQQAQEKELLAERFEQYAKHLERMLDDVTTQPYGGRIWLGPAAERFDGEVKRQKGRLRSLAGSCTIAARNLRRSARALRAIN